MARNTFFATEDIDNGGDAELVPEAQAEVEAGVAEAETRAREVEELTDATEEAADDIGTLTDISEVAQDAVDSGDGLDENAARVVETAVENIRNRLRLPTRKSIVPALESFGSRNSRVAATKIVIEGIGDWIKKIWEGIKAMCSRLLEKIKLFFTGITKSNESLSKLLENLKDRAQNISSSAEIDDTNLKNSSLARSLSVGKKANFNTAKEILTNSVKLLTAATTTVKHIHTFSDKASKIIAGSHTAKDYSDFVTEVRTKLDSGITNLDVYKTPTTVDKGNVNTASTTTWYGPFAGSKVLAWDAETTQHGLIANASGAPIQATKITRYSVSFEYQENIEASEIEALKRPEILTIIESALTTLDGKKKFDADTKDAEAVLKANEKLSEAVLSTIVGKAERKGDEADARVLRELSRDVAHFNSLSSSLSATASSIVFSSIKAAADYASASINNFKVKKS